MLIDCSNMSRGCHNCGHSLATIVQYCSKCCELEEKGEKLWAPENCLGVWDDEPWDMMSGCD